MASANRVSLTVDDYEALVRDAKHLSNVVPEVSASRQIKFGNKNLNLSIIGTTPNYMTVNGRKLLQGAMFSEADLAARRRVAILGYSVPDNLEISAASLIGSTITISRISFEIVGARRIY